MDYNTFIESVDEIIPGLWLGNEAISQSEAFMKKNNIKLIVNATKNIPSKFLGKIHYVRVPVDDPGILSARVESMDEDVKMMKESLSLILYVISRFHKKKCNILIHCHAGAQRSAIIVAAYLLYSGTVDNPQKAINQIIEKRGIAFFGGRSINFRNVLYNMPVKDN
jgi:hypothetical protein